MSTHLGYIVFGSHIDSTSNIANNTITIISRIGDLPIGTYMISAFHQPIYTGTSITFQELCINNNNDNFTTPFGLITSRTSGTNVNSLSVSGIVESTGTLNLNLLARYTYSGTSVMTVGTIINFRAIKIG